MLFFSLAFNFHWNDIFIWTKKKKRQQSLLFRFGCHQTIVYYATKLLHNFSFAAKLIIITISACISSRLQLDREWEAHESIGKNRKEKSKCNEINGVTGCITKWDISSNHLVRNREKWPEHWSWWKRGRSIERGVWRNDGTVHVPTVSNESTDLLQTTMHQATSICKHIIENYENDFR